MNAPVPLLEQLAEVGQAIHGSGWPREVARDLGPWCPRGSRGPTGQIDDRLVRRWISGERPVPAWVEDALPKILAAARFAATVRMDGAAKRLGYPDLGVVLLGMAATDAYALGAD